MARFGVDYQSLCQSCVKLKAHSGPQVMQRRKEGEILTSYILWSHSENKEGLHPVKLRVTHQRRRKYYSILKPDGEKLFLSKNDFGKIVETPLPKLRGEGRQLRGVLDERVQEAKAAIQDTTDRGKTPFSFSLFERKFLGADGGKDFLGYLAGYIDRLAKKGQAGTVRTYSSAYSALSKFLNGRQLDPADLTSQRLSELDEWLRLEKGLNDTSISIYMRCLRAVFNEMASSDEYLEIVYPFSRSRNDRKYKIPASSGQKGKTLSRDELRSFLSGRIQGETIPENPMYRAKQLFLFSFFGQGINFKDLALLKYANVGSEAIEFDRQKTIRTRTEARKVQILLNEELTAIIAEQGNPDKRKSSFVFSLFDQSEVLSEKEKDDRIRQWIKTTNKWLRRYCEYNKLKVVSTYASRHTFASLSKSHLPVALISQLLGHSRITTTQAYLGRFEDKETRAGLNKVFREIKKRVA